MEEELSLIIFISCTFNLIAGQVNFVLECKYYSFEMEPHTFFEIQSKEYNYKLSRYSFLHNRDCNTLARSHQTVDPKVGYVCVYLGIFCKGLLKLFR